MLLGSTIGPGRERVRRPAAGLVAGFDVVPEADERVGGKWRCSGDAVEVEREPGRNGVEGEVHLLRIDGDEARRLQSVRVGHGKADAIPRVAFEVVTAGRNGERTTLHSGDRSARVHVAFVEEVDVPAERAGRKRTVIRIRAVSAVRDHVTGHEEDAVGWRQNGRCRCTSNRDVHAVDTVLFTPSDTVRRAVYMPACA